MGFNPFDIITKPIGWLSGGLSGADDSRQREDQSQWDQGELRKGAKQKQYDLLGQIQAPTMSPQMETRLKALEDQSQPGELSQDPYFQGVRSQLVQGGQQALSGVQNNHAAYGTEGGFSNQGSAHDVYDRLGSQMASLGQQSVNLKDQKAGMAAQARQQFADAQTQYQNAQTRAKMAIEAGDTQAALAAMQQAYAARENIQAAQNQMTGSLISAGTAAATGGVGKANQPANSQQALPSEPSGGGDPYAATSGDQYAATASLPYAYQRAGSRGY